jgi:acyl-CoA thioesterase-1
MKSGRRSIGIPGFLAILAAIFFRIRTRRRRHHRGARRQQHLWQGGRAQSGVPCATRGDLAGQGANVRVVNAGINGDTTEGMLQRLDRTCRTGPAPSSCSPAATTAAKARRTEHRRIQSRLKARGIPVIMIPNGTFSGLPRQPDGQHLTPEGYHSSPSRWRPQVAGAIGR